MSQNRLVVQITSHNGPKFAQYNRIDGFPFRIGRSFNNEIILHDRFVSPVHLQVELHEDGGWVLRDLDSENGFAHNGSEKSGQEVRINSGDEIRLGHSVLTFYAEDHPVGNTVRLFRDHKILRRVSKPLVSWGICILSLIFMAIWSYLEVWSENTQETITYTIVSVFGMLLLWSALWAVAGRLVRHKAKFAGHMGIASLWMIFWCLFYYLQTYVAYLTNENSFSRILDYGVDFTLFAFLLYGCLTLATEMSQRRRTVISAVFSVGIMIGSLGFLFIDNQETKLKPDYPGLIEPYFSSWASSQDIDGFIKNSERAFDSKRLKSDTGS